jgi:hypothetical protein
MCVLEVMYLCVTDIDFASFYDFGVVSTVWYIFFHFISKITLKCFLEF